MDTNKIKVLQEKLGPRLRENVNLFPYLTLRTNVAAVCFTDAKNRIELVEAVRAAIGAQVPYHILGGGSNIALIHPEADFFVIKNSYSAMEIVADSADMAEVKVASGYPMAMLVNESVTRGWEGLEYHKGLPGSVGGAVYMNSKWTRPWKYVGDSLVSAVLLEGNGQEKQVQREYFRFAYDYSILQETKEMVIEAVFRFKKASPELLSKRAQEALDYRKKTQPFGVATAGCFFRNISKDEQAAKNLPTTSAGYLIDQSGMKGAKRGGFEVSTVHANFIINTSHADGKPADLLQLIGEIKRKVKSRFGVDLTEEVEVL